MTPNLIHLAIADDHTILRKTLTAWFSQHSNFKISIDASNGKELLDKMKFITVDVVLLDLFMPVLNGKETLAILREKYPQAKIIILSMSTEMPVISELLEQGIYGFISKQAEPAELMAAVLSASRNIIYENKILTKTLYWRANHSLKPAEEENTAHFSSNQKKVLELLWQEKSSQDIAREIFISVSAVEKIKQQLKEKTGVKTTVGLIKYAINRKIILVPEQKYIDNLS